MQPAVTQQMLDHMTAALEEQLMLRKSGHEPVVLPDDIILLIHNAADSDPSATLDDMIDEAAYLIKEYHGRETVREYFVLRKHFRDDDNMMTRVMLLLGLHHPERNREPMNPNDPTSVQRNIALLKAISLLRKRSYEKLLKKALAYNDQSVHQMEQGFRDNDCANLIIDYPAHWEVLISTMLERGYEHGMEAFRAMVATKSPALMDGAL